MTWKQMIIEGEVPMKKTLERLKNDFSSIRTGRANPALLDSVRVDNYNTLMPINQLATISVPDAKTIEIRPWDISVLPNVEKAILKADIGLTPVNDGKTIRLSMPSPNEERRKDLIKSVHKMAEDFKVSLRNERRHIADRIKKDKTLTEDDRKQAETLLQKVTDIYVAKVDENLKVKEKEIMEI